MADAPKWTQSLHLGPLAVNLSFFGAFVNVPVPAVMHNDRDVCNFGH